MEHGFRKSDARGSLQLDELEPGHFYVRVHGHLTGAVGMEFAAFAERTAERAERCSVYLDARSLRGFDPAVRDAWVEAVIKHRNRIDRIAVATQGVFISLAARTVSVALKPFGINLDVVNSMAEFEEMVVRAA
ncbi:MAG: STAS/SEC14 domain-containing protein [Archangium sp.]|nr:STAS/SEC14 domain-containing protein [Archangium sp.]